MHLFLLGLALSKVDLGQCRDFGAISATIKSYAETHPSAPRILCRGWMHSMTNAMALASMLDAVEKRPVFVDSKDLHSAWCNTAALEELGVEAMGNPAGGEIHRDESGRASGLLSEAAAVIIVWPHLSRVATMEEKLDGMRQAIRAYTAAGYTGMVDMAMEENAWEALQILKSQERLPIRLAAHWLINPSATDDMNLAQVDRAIALHKQFNAEPSPALRIAGIKIICDGVIDACTAALTQPYSSNGVSCDPLWSAEKLLPVIQRADSTGLQCALHAIGDRTIALSVSVLEQASAGPSRRHRIEHLELASAADARRLGALGITASIQPVHADPAILPLGTDAPTAPHAPLANIYVAATRRSAREPGLGAPPVNDHFVLPLARCFAAATAGAAYSCFAETWTGRLAAGLKADFAMLEMEWRPQSLLTARVLQTWFEGEMVYDGG